MNSWPEFSGHEYGVSPSIGAWWQEDDEIFRNNLAACRAALDESAFAQTVEEGRVMTMEQAIAYALEDQK